MNQKQTLQQTSRKLFRDSVFDAARLLLQKRLWSAVSMAQIARASGVSRQTIYNEFGTRESLLQAYILDDANRILSLVGEAMQNGSTEPAPLIQRAFKAFLDALRSDPLLPLSDNHDETLEGSVLHMLTNGGAPLLEYATQGLSEEVGLVWPSIPLTDRKIFSEQLVRLCLSHAVLPDQKSDDEVAATVAGFLTPVVQALLDKSA